MRTSLLLLLALAVGGCASPDYYSRGQRVPESLESFKGEIGVKRLWSVELGSGNRYADHPLIPAVTDARIYVADWNGDVYAVKRNNGERIWNVDLDQQLSAGPVVAGDVVVVGARESEVLGLDAETGEVLWRSGVTSEVLAPPAAAGGVVVARAADGRVFGLDLRDGSRRWIFDRTVPVLTLRGSSAPVILDGRALVGLDNGKLVALDLATGEPEWEATVGVPRGRTDLERMVDLDGHIYYARGTAYLSAYQGRTVAVNTDNGRIGWNRDIPSHQGVDADVGNLYVTDDRNRVWALDRFNGASVWRQERLSEIDLLAPVRYGNYLAVAGQDGYINWLDSASGELEARTRLDRDVFEVPKMQGAEVFQFVPPDWTAQPPVVHDSTLYVWTLKGRLIAYSLKGGER